MYVAMRVGRRGRYGKWGRLTNPVAIFAVLLLFGVLWGVFAAAAWQRQSDYATNGVTTQARVVDKDTGTRVVRNSIQRYHRVTYEFTLDGQTIRNESGVDEALYNALNVGDPLDIIYMPKNPSLNIPAANQTMVVAYVLAGIAALWNLVALGYGLRKIILPFAFLRRATA
jgi:hypothetical protein